MDDWESCNQPCSLLTPCTNPEFHPFLSSDKASFRPWIEYQEWQKSIVEVAWREGEPPPRRKRTLFWKSHATLSFLLSFFPPFFLFPLSAHFFLISFIKKTYRRPYRYIGSITLHSLFHMTLFQSSGRAASARSSAPSRTQDTVTDRCHYFFLEKRTCPISPKPDMESPFFCEHDMINFPRIWHRSSFFVNRRCRDTIQITCRDNQKNNLL